MNLPRAEATAETGGGGSSGSGAPDRPLRVAVDARTTAGNRAGIGVYTACLLDALEALEEPGLEVVRFGAGGDWHMRTPQRWLWDQWHVPSHVRRLGPSVLHCPGYSAPLGSPCPVVLTVHDLIPSLFPGDFSWPSWFYYTRWMPFTFRFAAAIITISEASRHDLLRLTRVPAERIEVIPLAAAPAYRPPPDAAALEAALARLGVRCPYVLGVSSIEPRKNFPMLVEAFELCRRRAGLPAQLTLVIAGSKDWGLATVQKACRGADLERSVTLTGYVSGDDLVALYQGAELFVFPSAYEGFGLPVLEAMACGTPVVASSVSSIPEVAGDACVLVPQPLTAERFAESMAAVLTDPGARADLGRRGLARAGRFSWRETARRTVGVYRRVARG
ncbi:MAG: glycosyltransferase family 4 protein [Candidatus Riflebacteria bacterium]|nr:glycosyltransferase family 4 protein [Candidatus Riflebacteria bacterium]